MNRASSPGLQKRDEEEDEQAQVQHRDLARRYVAGPDQSEDNPLGIGGEMLHEWAPPLKVFKEMHGRGSEGGEVNASDDVLRERFAGVGASIMGRRMFGPVSGPWGEDPWRGWWGEEPPFHHPVFVLTHHARSHSS